MGERKNRSHTRRPRGVWGRRLALGGVAVGLTLAIGGAAGCGMIRDVVLDGPDDHLDREHVRSIIAQESPVYYRDGTTRIGVFFEDEHRRYVSWEQLPRPYVVAIVAAEDGRFWSHSGIDARHIARAMRDNLKAGSVVAGGSTLTQQTAKNLYYRPDRSFSSKWEELLNALRLEDRYDKTEILTFYANQFHVSGNGRGLGIGARYFFDKEPEELTVLECAFLAGLVKSPSYYDPFIGDDARRARAVERAHDRTRYVLRRMLDESTEHLIWPDGSTPQATRRAEVERTRDEARRLLDEGFELSFRRGTFRFDSSAVLDEVARRLQEPPFDEVLEAAGVKDPSTAGLVVVTTLDASLQREAQYALWHHLTEVGAWLEALGPAAFLVDGRGPVYDPHRAIVAHDFRLGRVQQRVELEGRKAIRVDLGGRSCLVDRDGVVRAAVASRRGIERSRTAKASTAEVDGFLEGITDGSLVHVSVREVPAEGEAICDLEARPELQGAAVVLEDGAMRAMVGGNDNRNFNRATAALRQMGSTWKTLIYHSALTLGWSPTDQLDNTRQAFPFSGTVYYPRPDHEPQDVVSMSWAGVNSENLASVWLLYHLTDRLDGEGVRVLAQSLDLARRPGESEPDYRHRIQVAGVLPTPARVRESLFLQARTEVLRTTLQHEEDRLALSSMLYGWGLSGERAAAERMGSSSRASRQQALANAWDVMEPMAAACAAQYEVLAQAVELGGLPSGDAVDLLSVALAPSGQAVEVACGEAPERFAAPGELPTLLASAPPPAQVATGWPRFARPTPSPVRLVGAGDVLVHGKVHLSTLDAVASSLKRKELTREAAGADAPGLYEPDVLYWHQDFRVLLAMRYVASLAEAYGVTTEIGPVLSMPLGASEITLEEATALYEGLTTGQAWTFPGTARAPGGLVSSSVPSPPTPTLLISEIRSVDGDVLYRAKGEAARIASPEVAAATSDILRNVVRHGTGRRAADAVRVGGAAVPVGGKTGTTNDFKNAAFLGFSPVARGGGFAVEGGYAIGVYVGYDDNRPMTNGGIRLAGSSGALPAWIGLVEGLQRSAMLGEPGDAPDGGWMLDEVAGTTRVLVDGERGLVLAGEVAAEPESGEAPAGDPPSVLVPRATLPDPIAAVLDSRRPVRVGPRAVGPVVDLGDGQDGDPAAEEASAPPPRSSIWRRRR